MADDSQERLIYVAGTPSGGTSCVAGVLHHLGVDMGRFFEGRGVRGYVTYEDTDVEGFKIQPPGPNPILLRQRLRIRDYIEFRRERATDGRRIGVKGSTLWWLWDERPETLPLVVVRVVRPIEEAIRSDLRIQDLIHRERPDLRPEPLSATERVDRASAIAGAWQAAVEMAEMFPSVEVDFESLRAWPLAEVSRLNSWLGIEAGEEALRVAAASIRPRSGT